MKIITMCGSMKFLDKIMEISEKMELEGNCVLTPICHSDISTYTSDEILMLGKMHKEKIKISDAILVVDVDGYIGKTTKKEIEFAKSLGKEIIYYTDLIER